MSKKDDALKLALEALEDISSHYMSLPKKGCMALAAIEEALAEQPAQQQEPVACVNGCQGFFKHSPQPAQRKPLTDDPLQGAVDWLLEADGEYFCTATVQRTLRIGYNRAKRLCDTAKERAAHGIKGDA